jgi:hypothetical protein
MAVNRTISLSLAGVFLLSLSVKAITAWLQTDPINMDEAYHYINAVTLASGGGFNEAFIWNYLHPPDAVSHPGFMYWMPLTSLIAAAGILAGDISYDSAQSGFVLLSSILPLIAFGLAYSVSANIRHAVVVALLMIFSGFYMHVWTVTDSFTPFAVAGILAICGFSRHLTSGKVGWALFAGAMTGLANLARPDAPLFLVAFLLILALEYFGRNADRSQIESIRPTITVITLIGGFLLVMTPWYIRNFALFGAITPPGGIKTAWLCQYDDIFSYGKTLTFDAYITCGWDNILQSKWQALKAIAVRLYAEQGLIFVLPLAIIGCWKYCNEVLFRLALLYALLLSVSMSLVFTFPGPRGSWFHSAGVLLPFLYIAAIAGLDTLIDKLAKSWPRWGDTSTKPFFSVLMIALAVLLSVLMYSRSAAPLFDGEAEAYANVVAAIEEKSTVMVGCTTLFNYYGGWQSISIPSNGKAALLEAADRFSARYLVLDMHAPAALKQIYDGTESDPRLMLLQSFGTETGPVKLYQVISPADAI